MECDCHSKARKDEIGCVIERVAKCAFVIESALYHHTKRMKWVFANQRNDDARDYERLANSPAQNHNINQRAIVAAS